MYISKILTAAALGVGVATADFMVYTEPPIPTSMIPTFSAQSAVSFSGFSPAIVLGRTQLTPPQASSWTTMIYINAFAAYGAWERSGGSTYQSSLTSAQSEISSFAAASSNANFSIPAAVTDNDATTTFLSKPSWYTALPSGVMEFKEKQVSAQFSAVRDVVSRRATTGAAAGTGTQSGAGARETPRVGFKGVGMGGLAVIAAGVFL
jgi:hypothetical protein